MSRRPHDHLRFVLAHVRLLAIRYRAVYWTLAVTFAMAAGWSVYGVHRDADAARTAWGESAPVLLLAQPVEAGVPLIEADVRAIDAPLAVVPRDAVTSVGDDVVTRIALTEGTILASGLLVEPGADLDGDRRGVALPVTEATPPLHPGQAVELIGGSATLAPDARVVSIGDDQVVVAVPQATVPAVTAAARLDELTIVLLPAP